MLKNGTAVIGQVFDHTHRQGQITIITKGKSKISIGGVETLLHAGDIVFIPPGTLDQFHYSLQRC